jgi:hypothetical protein
MKDDKAALISIIEDYKERTQNPNLIEFYDEFIKDVEKAQTEDQLELYNKIVDGWIDY